MDGKWTSFGGNIKSFYNDEYIIHVIPTSNPHGNEEEYFIVVYDDAYFYETGKTNILTKDKIENKFNIKL